jgi:hypothetical protein
MSSLIYLEEYTSNELERVRKEVQDLNTLFNNLRELSSSQQTDLTLLEDEIKNINKEVLQSEKELVKAEDNKNNNRKLSLLISGSIGTLTGGIMGLILTPFVSPIIPVFAFGGAGIVYSLISEN